MSSNHTVVVSTVQKNPCKYLCTFKINEGKTMNKNSFQCKAIKTYSENVESNTVMNVCVHADLF